MAKVNSDEIRKDTIDVAESDACWYFDFNIDIKCIFMLRECLCTGDWRTCTDSPVVLSSSTFQQVFAELDLSTISTK